MTEFKSGEFQGMVLEKLSSIEAKLDAYGTRLDGHSNRLRALELWRAFLTGAMAIISGILGWMLGWGK